MPVVINQFEAVVEPPPTPSTAAPPAPAERIEPQALHAPLRRIARRHERLKAH